MPKLSLAPILVLIGLATFVGVIGYSLTGGSAPDSAVALPDFGSTEKPIAPVRPVGWEEYRNPAYGLTFFYPGTLTKQEYPEANGARTVTFEDVSGGKEFQIFIVPYAEDEITEERFRLDIPSGVRDGESSIAIADARGKAFYSRDETLGETREVWLIHGGYLYEVTTHKALAPWLDTILETWKFLPEAVR